MVSETAATGARARSSRCQLPITGFAHRTRNGRRPLAVATGTALLLKAAAETLAVIAADPKYLGADIGITAVLHTWGQNLHQNPHSRYRALSSP